jgi:hypothetical protein
VKNLNTFMIPFMSLNLLSTILIRDKCNKIEEGVEGDREYGGIGSKEVNKNYHETVFKQLQI